MIPPRHLIVVQHDGEVGHRLETGSPGWQLREEVAAIDGPIVICKRSCDAFHGTDRGGGSSEAWA